jgi:hypothetical protein
MKIGLNSVGVILANFGGIWLFQGINVLPGSIHDRTDPLGSCPRNRCSGANRSSRGCEPARLDGRR